MAPSTPSHTAATRAWASDGPTLFGHPRALYVLFFAEMWERFSYYGMRALLTLYMIQYLLFSKDQAGGVYGDYTGLVFLTPLLGGFIADRYLGLRKAIILGGLLMALGHALMAVDDKDLPAHPFLYSALLCLCIGNGFFKPNISTIVGQLYRPGDPRRDGGFTIFYMGVNLGAFLAPLACGWIGQKTWGEAKEYAFVRVFEPLIRMMLGGKPLTDATELWHVGFGLATIGMLFGVLVFVLGGRMYLGDIGVAPAAATDRPKEKAAPFGSGGKILLAALIVAGLVIAAFHAQRTVSASVAAGTGDPAGLIAARAMLWPVAATIVLVIFAMLMMRCTGAERTRVGALFLVIVFVMVFWGAFEQAGSSLTIFADEKSRLSIAGWSFESSMFQSVNPFCIIAFAPLFSAGWTWLAVRGKEPSTPIKLALGLALEGAAFAVMIAAANAAVGDEKISPLWLTAAYFLQTCGELCLSPVGLSMVTKLAPARFAALLMGVWFLGNSFGSKLGGVGAQLLQEMTPSQLFTMITVILAIATVVLLMCVPVLRRWMAGVK